MTIAVTVTVTKPTTDNNCDPRCKWYVSGLSAVERTINAGLRGVGEALWGGWVPSALLQR